VTGQAALLAFQIFGFVLVLYLMHQMYDRLRRDARRAPARDDGPESAHLRAGVGELVRELRQAADQINADMTSRANTLQKLVDEANEALRRLDAAAQRAGTAARPARSAGPARGSTAPTAGSVAAPVATGRAGRPRSRGVPSGQGADGRPDGARPSAGPEREEAGDGPWPGAPAGAPVVQLPPVAAGSPAAASAYRQSAAGPFVSVDLADTGRFQAVRRLSDQGLSTTEIARTIGLGREEVELIMRVNGGPS
jgi:hypothetical protein